MVDMPAKKKSSSSKSDPATYTKPELRDRIKQKVVSGNKGGNPGQWSARKAQLVTHEYEEAGGNYKKGRTAQQQSLKQWGDEKWQTSDKKTARRTGGTTRYLPEKAWSKLSGDQKETTNRKKQEGSRAGKQFIKNTGPAAQARKAAKKQVAAKKKTPAKKKR